MKQKSVKLEARTWLLLKEAKIKKADGSWETFNETIKRLMSDDEEISKSEKQEH
jgi:hypothetical protein